MVERRTHNPDVAGSIPAPATKFFMEKENNKIEIKLEYPIEVNCNKAGKGTLCETLYMRRAIVADWEAANKIQSETARDVVMVERLCGIAREDVLKLDMVDYQKLIKLLNDFLSPRETQ